MKCSEYLWKYVEIQNNGQGWSPERAQGELRVAIGNEPIVSDTTGERMTERAARSVLGRNEADLRTLYKEGDKAKFEQLVCEQLASDDGHHASKAEDGDGGEDDE